MSAEIPSRRDSDRAAILLLALDDNIAASLLSRLEPHELRLLGERMVELGEIGTEAIAMAVAGFVTRCETQGLAAHDRLGQVRAMMTRAVGETKAAGVIERIAPEASTAPALDLARWLSPAVLLSLVADEHPQVIALLLVQISPETAAEVLHGLAPDVQPQVIQRIAALGPVGPEALAMLDALLAERISATAGSGVFAMGGAREAADIVNAAHRSVAQRVLPALARVDKTLARQIESEMFTFEQLYALDDRSMGTLLREVESETLIMALKGIDEELRQPFLGAMSSRAADGVRDEIEARGRMRRSDALEAQKAMIATARRLAANGDISFGASDDEYV